MIIKLLRFVAIIIFDLLDKHLHQNRIKKFIRVNQIDIDFCIDVGAHNGYYSDLFLSINNKAKILMFEPQKKYFRLLKKKFKNKRNVKVFQEALSDKNSSSILYINKHDLTTTLAKNINNNLYFKLKAKLFQTNIDGMVETQVKTKVIRLDKKLRGNNKNIDLIKIDTEGYEFQVLKGVGKNLDISRYLIVEFHSKKTYLNYSPEKIHKFLIKKGFKLRKTFHFPLSTFEDRIYENTKLKKSIS